MTASLESALRATLQSTWPRPGFAQSLLSALREASVTPIGVVDGEAVALAQPAQRLPGSWDGGVPVARPHVPRGRWGGSSLIMSFNEGGAG